MNGTINDTETPEAKSKRLKAERDRRYKEKQKAAKLAPIADKRLEGALKVHGATDAEAKAVVNKRRAELAKPIGKSSAAQIGAQLVAERTGKTLIDQTTAPVEPEDEKIITREPKPKMSAAKRSRLAEDKAKGIKRKAVAEGIEVTMGRTYQREGNVASGMERAGAKQLAIMFPVKMFDKMAKLAKRSGISVSEQVRQFVAAGLATL